MQMFSDWPLSPGVAFDERYRRGALAVSSLRLSMLLVLALFGNVVQAVRAVDLTPQSVEEIVQKSPGFGKDRKVTIAVRANEVDLSTYVLSANAPATDLKIEALAVSKAIIEANASVARVKLRFYEPAAPTRYREVVVTISDINAFSSGVITKDQLLAALNVEARTDGQAVQSGAGAGAGGKAGGGKPMSGTSLQRYTAMGISVDYPSTWSISNEPLSSGYFVKFETADGSSIMIRHTASEQDVSSWVAAEDREHEQRRSYARVAVPQHLRVGPNGSIVAYNRAYSHGDAGNLVYTQYVYFGWLPSKYKFKLVAPQKAYIGSAQVFANMLNSVRITHQ